MEQEQIVPGPITAKELSGILADMPDDTLIVMASDAEGNEFHLMEGYDPATPWDTKLVDIHMEPDPSGQHIVNCVIFYPKHR